MGNPVNKHLDPLTLLETSRTLIVLMNHSPWNLSIMHPHGSLNKDFIRFHTELDDIIVFRVG